MENPARRTEPNASSPNAALIAPLNVLDIAFASPPTNDWVP